jgi:adenosylmethionine-8-amino-7-oxononanoate aminotransferase
MIAARAFDLGLIVYEAQGCADGKNGDLIHIGPSLIVTEAQLEAIVSRVREAVESLSTETQELC